MNALEALAGQVEQLFSEVDLAVGDYASRTGLACPEGCGACCHSREIEVTVLDALPLARAIVAGGQAEAVLERIAAQEGSGCPMFLDHGGPLGRCTAYAKRPTLCRLYGFAAVTDKHGAPVLALCRIQKDLGARVDPEVKPPLFAEFSRRLVGIDPDYGTRYLPIHRALGTAIEKVLLLSQLTQEAQNGAPEKVSSRAPRRGRGCQSRVKNRRRRALRVAAQDPLRPEGVSPNALGNGPKVGASA